MIQYNLAANPPVNNLITDIKSLIQEARSGLAATVNAELTLLYWRIGSRIRSAAYGAVC